MARADQVAFRRLENGDYLRVLVDRETHAASIFLGAVEEDDEGRECVNYRWAMELSIVGLADLQRELAQVACVMSKQIDATFNQAKDEVSNLRAARAQL